MKHPTPKMLGAAFASAILEHPNRAKQLAVSFVDILRKKTSPRNARRAVEETEKMLTTLKGGRNVEIFSASPLDKKIIKDISKKLNENDNIREISDPKLIAGIKIVIDGEAIMDNSFKRKMQKLFPLHF